MKILNKITTLNYDFSEFEYSNLEIELELSKLQQEYNKIIFSKFKDTLNKIMNELNLMKTYDISKKKNKLWKGNLKSGKESFIIREEKMKQSNHHTADFNSYLSNVLSKIDKIKQLNLTDQLLKISNYIRSRNQDTDRNIPLNESIQNLIFESQFLYLNKMKDKDFKKLKETDLYLNKMLNSSWIKQND